MSDNTPRCAHCDRTSDEVPVIGIKFKKDIYWICPQHLPVLIHNPHNMVGKLPGAENLSFEGDGS